MYLPPLAIVFIALILFGLAWMMIAYRQMLTRSDIAARFWRARAYANLAELQLVRQAFKDARVRDAVSIGNVLRNILGAQAMVLARGAHSYRLDD